MTTSSYLTRLPRTLFDSLATRSRGPHGMIDAPPGHVREEIAKAALTSGIAARGPVLDYVVKRLRHGLGYGGDRPTPPDLRPGETAFVDRRIDEALSRLRHELEQAEGDQRTASHLRPDAGGFTPAVDVMAPEERHRVDELAARRRARNTAGHGGAA
jgi:hypothetical protein